MLLWDKIMAEVSKEILEIKEGYEQKYGFSAPENYSFRAKRGLSEEIVRQISAIKGEPEWMTDFRLKALKIFFSRPMPAWGADLSTIDFDNIFYYIRPTEKKGKTWDDMPPEIKNTFDRLGIPEAEQKFLGGVGAQYESESVYHHIRKDLEQQGVIFLDMDSGLRECPEIVKKHFGKIIPAADNKFAALNSAVWSGGSFVYVPEGVKVATPLQAYFRINAKNMGQFERTLIITEPNSSAHYTEGCTAPSYSTDSLHAAVVEIVAKENSKLRYTTIQNWSNNVYNLVTKRAHAHRNAVVEWIDGNLGCLVEDTKVFTNNDIKEIKDVKEGDFVYSLDPDFKITRQKVLARKENPEMPVYKLRTMNHREVIATANHPFLVMSKHGNLLEMRWKKLDEIETNDLIGLSGIMPDTGKPMQIEFNEKKGKKPIMYPKQTDDEFMWLLGFYVGDGYTDNSRLYFAVPENDKSNVKVKSILKETFGADFEQKGVVIRTNSVDLVAFFKFMGMTGNAKTKRVPKWINKLPESQKNAFIQGYIDADGHTRKGHKNVSITSVNKELLEDIKILAMSCGMNPMKISKWSRRERKPLGIEEKLYEHYFLYFSDNHMTQPVYFSKLQSIEPSGNRITYDIEVDGTHNFIANGIIVHNSKITMKYPSVYLLGEGSQANIVSVAYAGKGQHQDAGGKAIHMAKNTSSTILSKSISRDGGKTTYRGLLKVAKGATGVKSNVRCDALILDNKSASDTVPYMDVAEKNVSITHEATVGKISEEQLFYLMARGLAESEAMGLVVRGFIEPFTRELPMEYAVELNRLVQMEMTGAVG